MYSRTGGYQNLHDAYHERDTVAVSKQHMAYNSEYPDNGTTDTEPQWYWRLVAQVSVWMILGGFLAFPSGFDNNPQLRFSKSVLAIIIVVLLTGGYSLTLLLYVTCHSPLFRQESIFIPVASASLFSFLAILYCLAASSRFTFSLAPCPIALALSAMSAILYGTLAFCAGRRVHTKSRNSRRPPQRRTHHRDLSSSSYNDTRYSPAFNPNPGTGSSSNPPSAGLWMEPGYYTNFIANMHPSSMRPKKTPPGQQPLTLYDPAIGTTYTRLPGGASAITDDELVARQMAGLLRKKDPGPSPDASSSTFRLDWEFNEEEEEGAARRRATLGEGAARKARMRTRSVGEGMASTGPVVKITRADSVGRGRSESRNGGVGRAKSREERRREIELQNLGA